MLTKNLLYVKSTAPLYTVHFIEIRSASLLGEELSFILVSQSLGQSTETDKDILNAYVCQTFSIHNLFNPYNNPAIFI